MHSTVNFYTKILKSNSTIKYMDKSDLINRTDGALQYMWFQKGTVPLGEYGYCFQYFCLCYTPASDRKTRKNSTVLTQQIDCIAIRK